MFFKSNFWYSNRVLLDNSVNLSGIQKVKPSHLHRANSLDLYHLALLECMTCRIYQGFQN